MSAEWKTRVLVKDLRVAFGLTNAELNAHVVRLTVLYEDLKIELTGSRGTPIPRLEFYVKSARQHVWHRFKYTSANGSQCKLSKPSTVAFDCILDCILRGWMAGCTAMGPNRRLHRLCRADSSQISRA